MPPITLLIAMHLSHLPFLPPTTRASTDPTLSSLCCYHPRALSSPDEERVLPLQTSGGMADKRCHDPVTQGPNVPPSLSPAYLVRQLRAK
jgi:hypothetical protein